MRTKLQELVYAEAMLSELRQLRDGSFKITLQQFRNALKRSIGASKDYADGCWIPFQNSPCHYICSRTDEAQSVELVKVCMKLGEP